MKRFLAFLFCICSCAAGAGFDDDVPYLRGKWRADVTDRATGIGLEEPQVGRPKFHYQSLDA